MTQPTDRVQQIATDPTFTTGPGDTLGQPCSVTRSDAVAAQGHVAGTRLRFQHLNDDLRRISLELLHRQEDVTAWCGDGSDGDDTNDGTLTLTRDVYYNVFINNGTVILNGYRLFARVLTNNGVIHCDGEDGADATEGAPDTPGAGGAGAPNGSVQGGRDGGDGAVFGGNDGASGSASSYMRWGSVGSDGGDAVGNTGGAAGGALTPTITQGGIPRTVEQCVRAYNVDLSTATARIVQAVGGTGGGGGASNVSDAGGGGGGGAGVGIISANALTNTGTIRANGGAGGTGTAAAGDGGFGGAGALRLIFRNIFDTGTIEALDGDGTDRTSTNVMLIRV